MAKFLTITVSGVDYIIPQNGYVAVLQEPGFSNQTNINYTSVNSTDQIRLSHDSDSGKLVQDFIKDKFKEMAETNWTNAIIDITDDCPLEITIVNVA